MNITIAGGHGKIAMLLHPLLNERGHQVQGLIRDADQGPDLRQAGAEPVLCDLEKTQDLSAFVDGTDVVIFAAGAGPGSGLERKFTMDRDGALNLIDAMQRTGVRRFVMISAMDGETPRGEEVFQAYLQAKAEADAALRASGLDYTIIRPGKLTDEPATGRVEVGAKLERAEISRADVAAVVAEAVDMPTTIGKQFDVVRGSISIRDALSAL